MYTVLKYFTDLTDNNYAYHAGDKFPRDGMTVDDDRIGELSTKKNRRGVPLIKKDAEPVKKGKKK